MAIDPSPSTLRNDEFARTPRLDNDTAEAADVQPGSNLAALLDQFTASITNPGAHTVGSFAHTVQALHGELALLARHFGADAADFDALDSGFDADGTGGAFPEGASPPAEALEPGIAASEELEHLCRELSR